MKYPEISITEMEPACRLWSADRTEALAEAQAKAKAMQASTKGIEVYTESTKVFSLGHELSLNFLEKARRRKVF